MYSLVLMMAVGTGGEVPASHDASAARPMDQSRQLNRCFGGGGCGGLFGGRGCNGGCWGGGRCGCHGGGWGGCRGGGGWGCHGGGWGGCYGGGMAYGGCYGGGMAYQSGYYAPPAHGSHYYTPTTPPDRQPGERIPPPDRPPGEAAAPNAATIVVTLPADARLTIDDTITRSTAAVRTFVSPPLEPGQSYYYTLKAEVTRGGQPVAETKRVSVRAGEQTRVSFDFPPASVASR